MQGPYTVPGAHYREGAAAAVRREAPCDESEAEWQVPERFVARRPAPTGPGWQVLVKWTSLGYEHCTWEVRSPPPPPPPKTRQHLC